jgi:hypothetical protein
MRSAQRQLPVVRFISTLMVACVIVLVLALSIAITSGVGHGFDQIDLALPIFFVLLFLAVSVGDWLQVEALGIETQRQLSTSHTRAPPA